MVSASDAPAGARVLIVGSGGREHALGAAMRRSPTVGEILFAGGPNAGLDRIARQIAPEAIDDAAATADLVIIGPEAPLAEGVSDRLRAAGRAVFGPSAAAARLETSKAYTKEVCAKLGLPTARAEIAESLAEGLAAVRRMGAPVVVKADGLAAGKGVIVTETLAEAEAAVASAMDGAFGEAGHRVVIEERLEGPEVSLFALSDGTTIRPFGSARDYKRAFDADRGPNTGGMGAVSPAPGFTAERGEDAMSRILRPTLEWLAAESMPYVGVLYAGLMLTRDGPKLIEYNVRFGDPECQIMWQRVRSDPYALLHATATGRLADAPPMVADGASVGVVVAAEAYPGPVERGEEIRGIEAVEAAGAAVYHSGTKRDGERVLANGGRVLTAVATGSDTAAARAKVYAALAHLDWPGGRMRGDIAA